MAGPVVNRAVSIDPERLTVIDAELRIYAGRSRDGAYAHVVAPRPFDVTDGDGNVMTPAGALTCTCRGFYFHGHCYRVEEAEAFERSEVDVDWMFDIARAGA